MIKIMKDQEKNWEWLRYAGLKKETESTIFAAQEQAIATNSIRHSVYKEIVVNSCRICGSAEETVAHITTDCQMLAQRYYKEWRHDQVAKVVRWKSCKKEGIPREESWYKHTPEKVSETDEVKLLWDLPIQTDNKLDHNRPDIVVVNKSRRSCLLVDIVCPFDTRIVKKEKEKIDVYQDFRQELKRLWNLREIKIITVIIGAFGTIGMNHRKWLEQIDINCRK